ncbi:MAG: hypothetical protein GWP15_03775, partial [Nitrospirae bacterium]|nr:hypothetical protein [Nitrospirota bacterium]
LDENEVVSLGYEWKEKDEGEYRQSNYKIPEEISDISKAIVDEILACEKCRKNYKIDDTELSFYRRMKLPIPLECYECRHTERFNMRNPRKLCERECDKCGVSLQTTFSSDRDEKVYCEKCYLESVY